MVVTEKNVTDFFVMLFLCFVLFQPNSRKMKWSPELTSEVYAVKSLRPSYPGKAQPSNDAVLQSTKNMGAFRNLKSIQSNDIYGHFDGLH